MIVNVLNLERRKDRKKSAIAELESQQAPFMFWPSIELDTVKTAISRSHKQVIQFAKNHDISSILVAEDDLKFTHPKAYDYFLANIPKEPFDLYLASYYSGEADENHILKTFRGLTMYVCSAQFYDTFLSVPENRHIDAALSATGGKFVVCHPFVAIQYPGYSDQRKRMVDDSSRLKGKLLYNGE